MRRTTLRRTRLALGLLAASLTLSACEFDVYSLPLPGGPDTGEDPITVTAMFADVLDLVPKSTVKINDITVGAVTDVDLDGYTALVAMELQNDVDLPDDAVARLTEAGASVVSQEMDEAGGVPATTIASLDLGVELVHQRRHGQAGTIAPRLF